LCQPLSSLLRNLHRNQLLRLSQSLYRFPNLNQHPYLSQSRNHSLSLCQNQPHNLSLCLSLNHYPFLNLLQ
jgi:hypothetical protein